MARTVLLAFERTRIAENKEYYIEQQTIADI